MKDFRDEIAFEYMKYELRTTDPCSMVMKPEALKQAELRRKQRIAKEAYDMAECMIEERGKRNH
jgi:hypothetical protein